MHFPFNLIRRHENRMNYKFLSFTLGTNAKRECSQHKKKTNINTFKPNIWVQNGRHFQKQCHILADV